jgi:hypothetical protein
MFILIPVAEEARDATISMIADAKKWALVEADGGGVVDVAFYDDREEIEEFIEAVVVRSKHDHVAPFFEESIPVLEVPAEMNIDQIIEAYMFRELYEVPIQF